MVIKLCLQSLMHFVFCLLFRAFCFKKKSSSGTTKVEVPSKVISSNVLANRNVNVPKSSLVTESPLTFSNKLERPQKSKVNSLFTASSKGMSDSISLAGDCAAASQTPSAVSAIKAATAPTKSDNQFTSSTRGTSSLDAPLGFPLDDWDDFDDFETPVKTKKDSFSSEITGKSNNTEPSPGGEKTQFAGKNGLSINEQSCIETDELDNSVDKAAILPGPSLKQDPAESELVDSPIKTTRRRRRPPPPPPPKSVFSDSEEDNDVEFEPFKGTAGKKLFVEAFVYFICTLFGRNQESFEQAISLCLSDNKKTWIDPKVIELDENTEPEDDLDFIPPSPIPDEISSALETRPVP